MYSTLVRVQNVFGFFTTVAFTVAALVAVSVVLTPQNPSATVILQNVQVVKGRAHYNSPRKEDYASIKFDLEADFTSLFNWNTKQLFVYVLATYPALKPSTPPSQAIIWDTIISSNSQLHPFDPWTFLWARDGTSLPPFRKDSKNRAGVKGSKKGQAKVEIEPGRISLKNQRPKYKITDISGKLADRGNVTLEVGWNVQPWVGALLWTTPAEGVLMGRWKAVTGGKTEQFTMPAIKGSVPPVKNS